MSVLSTTDIKTTQVIADVSADLPVSISIPLFLENDHLEVYECVASVGETAHSVATLLVISTNYTIAQAEDGTGTITVSTLNALTGAATIVVINNPDIERTADFSANNYLDIDALEEQIDQMALKMKQMEAVLNRCVRFDLAGIMAGADDVAVLGEIDALVTDEETDDKILVFNKALGKFYWSLPSEVTVFSPKHGRISVSVPAALAATTTPQLMAGTTVLGSSPDSFDMPSNGRLRYTGVTTIHAVVAASISMTSDTNNVVVEMGIAKNGTIISESTITRKIGTGSDVGAMAVLADMELEENDYVELYISLESSTAAITVEKMLMYVDGSKEA